jgi:UDP-N-acetylmuramoyl-L-alanyl-D-glutamate--2,6-diaminopimelate ligase
MNDQDILGQIQGLTADSRIVKPGYLFAALPGAQVCGSLFIQEAINNGATYILAAPDTQLPDPSPAILITDQDPRRRFSILAAGFYKKQPHIIVAVTGTNGKTSTVSFTSQLWDALGQKSASLGTLGIASRFFVKSGGLTTPDPVNLHAQMHDLVTAGITHLAMEASSIGIEQRRLDGVQLSAAGFINLTHDHLDYHITMDAYYEAKKRLFTTLLPRNAKAIIYTDDPYGQKLAYELQDTHPLIRIGKDAPEIKIIEQTPTPEGQILKIESWGKAHTLHLPLVGLFQGLNALVAAGFVIATAPDITFGMLVPYLEKLQGVSGRLQKVTGHPKGASIYVDYAHTPHGLETVLKALRPHTRKKLIVVFGCGGNRDKSKRPIMGDIATTLADITIITDDNPRHESASVIRQDIIAGAPQARVIPDRKTAIFEALSMLESGDILVIAGKGHEQGQIIGDVVQPFDDIDVTRECMNAL